MTQQGREWETPSALGWINRVPAQGLRTKRVGEILVRILVLCLVCTCSDRVLLELQSGIFLGNSVLGTREVVQPLTLGGEGRCEVCVYPR